MVNPNTNKDVQLSEIWNKLQEQWGINPRSKYNVHQVDKKYPAFSEKNILTINNKPSETK